MPTTVGAGAHGLSNSLLTLGISSKIWAYRNNYIDYHIDYPIFRDSRSFFCRELYRLFALTYIFRADLFFFNFGSSLFTPPKPSESQHFSLVLTLLHRVFCQYLLFMQQVELFLLVLLSKPFYVLYQGDDVRQGEYLLANYEQSLANICPPGYYNYPDDEFKRDQLNILASRSNGIFYLNPDLASVLPSSSIFLPYCHYATASSPFESSCLSDSSILRIAHAPTNRQIKGTECILNSLDILKREGFKFELDLVENVSHSEALHRYSKCHLLIDQLFAGWYGGVALECMAMSIPVACFIRDSDLSVIPPLMAEQLPILRIDYSLIVKQLRSILVKGPSYLVNVGLLSKAFVSQWHSPEYVASILEQVIFTSSFSN